MTPLSRVYQNLDGHELLEGHFLTFSPHNLLFNDIIIYLSGLGDEERQSTQSVAIKWQYRWLSLAAEIACNIRNKEL